MNKIITWITLLCFIATHSPANADASGEGFAAGQAAIPVIRGGINAPNATAIVPDDTSHPPSGNPAQSDLASAARARLAACATAPDDPVCQALTAAMTSANAPRAAVSPRDPAVAGAHAIAQNPASILGSLSGYYAGCAAGGPCPANVFCLGTSCFNTAYANDPDFARVSAMLEGAREAGVYLDPGTRNVFSGEADSCRDRLLKNCCAADASGAGMSNHAVLGAGSHLVFDILMHAQDRQFIMQGVKALLSGGGFAGNFTSYGVTFAVNGAALPAGSVTLATGDSFAIGFDPWSLAILVAVSVVMSLAACSQDEARLALQEGAGLCHSTGTYCSSCIRVLGHCVSCIEHSTGKCCFNSRLARIVNEQGRSQFGKGWGTPQSQDCAGFTVAQLQSLDFAKMDLREFYASIVPALPNVPAIRAVNTGRAAACIAGQGRCQ